MIDFKDWITYTAGERELMLKIYEVKNQLDIIDIMLLRNIKDQELLKQHFDNKQKKQIIELETHVKGSLK
jgi:hypothetical protein